MKRRALKGEGHEGCQVEAASVVELSLSQLGLWQPCVAKTAFQGRFCHLTTTNGLISKKDVFSIKFKSKQS